MDASDRRVRDRGIFAEGDAMEIGGSVWKRNRWSVLAAILGLNLFTYSTGALSLASPTSSYAVLASDAASTSTSKTTPDPERSILRISRATIKTSEGMEESRFGVLTYEGKFLAYTLEHESVKIPTGRYAGELRWSKRFGETVVYIHVPKRSGIEIHRGNCPVDSGGCVLVGSTIDGACLDNSKQAFERTMEALPQTFTVVVSE